MTKANVILFICDDLAWGDLACYGNPYVHTPFLDSLFTRSACLDRHCSGPLCSPARASLLTGRYHLRTRVIDTYCGRSIMEPTEKTLGHLFQSAGYRTGVFGKWHLGDCYPSRPIDMGFDRMLVHGAGGIGQPGDHPDNHARWYDSSYFDPVLNRDGVFEKQAGYCADIFTAEALAFIDDSCAHQQPFFAYVSTPTPHSPFLVEESWAQKYRSLNLPYPQPEIYGMVENIDWNVGRIIEHLKAKSILEDTLFIFTSDHGPCPSALSHHPDGSKESRWNDGLRGMKGSLYEGGIRVPSFFHWPQKWSAQTRISVPTSPIDFYPTLHEWFAPGFTSDKPIDGESLCGLLESRTDCSLERDTIFMQWHRGDFPVRNRNAAVIESNYKWYRRNESEPAELYAVLDDPAEEHNIADVLLEKASAMQAKYNAWFTGICQSVGRLGFDPPAIVLGSPEEEETLLTTNDWRIIGKEDWCRDDLRGYWKVHFEREGNYQFRLRFRTDAPYGLDFLSVGGILLAQQQKLNHEEETVFSMNIPNAGSTVIEAWRELFSPLESAYNSTSLAALYVWVKKL